MRTQPQDIILELEADNSRLAKEAVLQKYMESSEGYGEFFEGVKMALDKLYTFGVQHFHKQHKMDKDLNGQCSKILQKNYNVES